jgi:hypothetical protein
MSIPSVFSSSGFKGGSVSTFHIDGMHMKCISIFFQYLLAKKMIPKVTNTKAIEPIKSMPHLIIA